MFFLYKSFYISAKYYLQVHYNHKAEMEGREVGSLRGRGTSRVATRVPGKFFFSCFCNTNHCFF